MNSYETQPSNYFSSPEHVLKDKSLSDKDKVRILKSWELQCELNVVADEEGMLGPNHSEQLRQIKLCLHKLAS